MEGVDLLGRVREFDTNAKRGLGLLVRWGDRSSAQPILRAMALGHFDHYLPKPATAHDEAFHEIVEGFLADWPDGKAAGTAHSHRR